MGEAKRRKEAGEFPEQDGRTAAEREADAIRAVMEAERIPTMPSPFSWDCLRLRDQETKELQLALVMHTVHGPQHYFFAPEDFGKFRKFVDAVGDAAEEEVSGLTIVKNGIEVPGADAPI